ncbi:MAG TPA: NUDIX hydrolase [Flavobacteriales bacterium]|nr:NUDIX hydrolase [Flavobacteriales bacterium]
MKKEGAVVVILDEQDRMLILLRPSHAWWAPNTWGLPGGKLEPDEAPLHAAVRETKEETQLDVRDLKIIHDALDSSVYAYYTRDYTGDIAIDHEHDDWMWAPRGTLQNTNLSPNVLELYEWVINNGKQ